MHRKIQKTALVSLIALLPFSCPTCFPPKEYVVGVVGTETGPDAEKGISVIVGAKLRCDEINKSKKKLNKRYLTCVHYDDAGDPDLTESHVRRLIEVDEAVVVIVASVSPEGAGRASKVCGSAGVPLISVSGYLSDSEGLGGPCYEIGPDDADMSTALVDYVEKTYGYKRAGFVTIGDYKLPAAAKGALSAGEDEGKAVVLDITVGTDDIDLISATPDIRFAELDVLYVYATTRDAFRLTRELEVDGVFLPIVNIKPLADPDVMSEEVTTSESVILITPIPLEYGEPRGIKFDKYFEDVKGYKPNFYAALGYDAMDLAAYAIKDAGDTDPGKLETAWDKLGLWEGIVGNTDFKTGKTKFKYHIIEVTIIANKPKITTLTVIG